MGRNWKAHERQVAALCGGQRQPNTGGNHEDVSHPVFSFQVKHREKLPEWFLDAIEQARGDAGTKVPVVVFCLSSQGIKTRRFFVVDEEGWKDLHGSAKNAALEDFKDVTDAHAALSNPVNQGKRIPWK